MTTPARCFVFILSAILLPGCVGIKVTTTKEKVLFSTKNTDGIDRQTCFVNRYYLPPEKYDVLESTPDTERRLYPLKDSARHFRGVLIGIGILVPIGYLSKDKVRAEWKAGERACTLTKITVGYKGCLYLPIIYTEGSNNFTEDPCDEDTPGAHY